ncbi:MAG TPA: serine/threonine protein kinase, partial [Labilithrix sp.]|nr:serine/threonine protein kinase [Labilithrix sp.]
MKGPSTDLDGLPKVGDLVGGKFRITETLGQGGMGVVFGGEHLDLRQSVAIKVLRPALAREPDSLARFLREARAAASITGRHAVRIYDVGTTEEGVPYMI